MDENVQDVSDVSDAESGELEKPPTPEIHYEDNSREFEKTSAEQEEDVENDEAGDQEEEDITEQARTPEGNDSPGSEKEEQADDADEDASDKEMEPVDEETDKGLSENVTDDVEHDSTEIVGGGSPSKEDNEGEMSDDVEHDHETKSPEQETTLTEPEQTQGGSQSTENDSVGITEEQSPAGQDEKEEEEEDKDIEAPLSPLTGVNVTEDLSCSDAAIINDIMTGVDNDDAFDDSLGFPESLEEEDGQQRQEGSMWNMDEAGPSQAEDMEDHPSEAVGELIDEIFGSSDEEEEFEGFGHEDVELSKKRRKDLVRDRRSTGVISDDEEEEEYDPNEGDDVVGNTVEEAIASLKVPPPPEKEEDSDSDIERDQKVFESDFDRLVEKRKELNKQRRRKYKDSEFIGDSDDAIQAMIKKMHEAYNEDRMANEAKQAATKKLKMLPTVLAHLNKSDLQCALLENGILASIKEWLSALPDGSLPHLEIRTGLLKTLSQFPPLDSGRLKSSGIGKAVMFVYRHPKETRHNKEMSGKLINEWARPIFGVTANFKSLSREEREERDYQNMSKRRRLSSSGNEAGKTPKSIDKALQGSERAKRPGDKGWIGRARVPMPSNKDYVVRPKSSNDTFDFSRGAAKKSLNRFEKQSRKFKERKALSGRSTQRAVAISIEGRKMSL